MMPILLPTHASVTPLTLLLALHHVLAFLVIPLLIVHQKFSVKYHQIKFYHDVSVNVTLNDVHILSPLFVLMMTNAQILIVLTHSRENATAILIQLLFALMIMVNHVPIKVVSQPPHL
jgi:hypothetical protein